jgi:hypothetical protein
MPTCHVEVQKPSSSLPVYKVIHVLGHEKILVHNKRWDVTVPAVTFKHGLLIEVQGQGHNTRLMNKHKASDSSMAARQLKDEALKKEALTQGWNVLWLVVNEGVKSRKIVQDRWAAKLKQAMAHVVAGGDPMHFQA